MELTIIIKDDAAADSIAVTMGYAATDAETGKPNPQSVQEFLQSLLVSYLSDINRSVKIRAAEELARVDAIAKIDPGDISASAIPK